MRRYTRSVSPTDHEKTKTVLHKLKLDERACPRCASVLLVYTFGRIGLIKLTCPSDDFWHFVPWRL